MSGSKEKSCRTCGGSLAEDVPFDQCLGCRWDGLTKVAGQRLLNMGWRRERAFSCFFCSSAAESFEHAWRVWDGRQKTYSYKFVCDDCAASHCWKCGQREDALSACSLCPLCAGNIPEELKARPQWVVWRFEPRETGEKPAKPPYSPTTLQKASHSKPDHWATFKQALHAHARKHLEDSQGIGFVFSKDDRYAGVDLDDCRNPDTGVLEPWAEALVAFLNSYTEVSPSKKGVKVFLKGRPTLTGKKRKGNIEIYDRNRYFTMTGLHVEDTPKTIEDRQDEIILLQSFIRSRPKPKRKASRPESLKPEKEKVPKPNPNKEIPDDELRRKMFNSSCAGEISLLWKGGWAGSKSPSEADLALVRHLAYWTGGDEDRMDAWFRQSGLMRPKWDKVHKPPDTTYGQMTIAEAIRRVGDYYDPKYADDTWRNRRTAPKPKPGDGSIRVYSELAADSLKRGDVAHFILWCGAMACDPRGMGKAKVRDVIDFLRGVYSEQYLWRLLSLKQSAYFQDTEAYEPKDPKWKCIFCHRRICWCEETRDLNEERYLHYRSPARMAGELGLGVAVDVPLKHLEGRKDKCAALFASYLAGRPRLPMSQDSLRRRTGKSPTTQWRWRKDGYFDIVEQFNEIEVPPGKKPNPALLKRGAVQKDGKLTYQISNVHIPTLEMELSTSPPSPWLRKQLARSLNGAGGIAQAEQGDGGDDAKPLHGQVYFTSGKKRREQAGKAADVTYVHVQGSYWSLDSDDALVDGELVPVFVEEENHDEH